jgi:hypothetical protein
MEFIAQQEKKESDTLMEQQRVIRETKPSWQTKADPFVVPLEKPAQDAPPKREEPGLILPSRDPGGAGGGDNVLVNSVEAADANFNDSLPAPATNRGLNVAWQIDNSDVHSPSKISAHVPTPGDATLYLDGTGHFTEPSGGGGGGVDLVVIAIGADDQEPHVYRIKAVDLGLAADYIP